MGIATDVIAVGTGIFTAIAARAAWKSAEVSAQQLTDQKQEQMRVERPRLVPLNKYFTPHPTEILSDWRTGTEINYIFTEFSSRYSNLKIPIINTGKSFAVDINYIFSLEGRIDAIQNFSSGKSEVVVEFSREEESKLRLINSDTFTFQVYDYDSNYAKENDKRTKTYIFHVTPYERHISLIKSGETDELYIPNYFVVLCNIYLQEYHRGNHKQLNRPKLKLDIQYRDQYNEVHIDQYMMELSTKQFEGNNYTYMIEGWIDFVFIKPVGQ